MYIFLFKHHVTHIYYFVITLKSNMFTCHHPYMNVLSFPTTCIFACFFPFLSFSFKIVKYCLEL